MPILRSEQRALEEFRERLSSSYLVKDMKVFGSKARGADGGDSE
jgi:predicted nucleotidyltransferase